MEAHLYLGSAQNAAVWRQLKAFNITHVLVVGTECKAYFPGHFKYLHFDVCDRDDDTRIRDAFGHPGVPGTPGICVCVCVWAFPNVPSRWNVG